MWKKTAALRDQIGDVHTKIMKKNYKEVPQWWFHIILISMVIFAIFCCEGFGKQLQLPWWGVLMACGIALFFTLPIGIIQATTNMVRSLLQREFVFFIGSFKSFFLFISPITPSSGT